MKVDILHGNDKSVKGVILLPGIVFTSHIVYNKYNEFFKHKYKVIVYLDYDPTDCSKENLLESLKQIFEAYGDIKFDMIALSFGSFLIFKLIEGSQEWIWEYAPKYIREYIFLGVIYKPEFFKSKLFRSAIKYSRRINSIFGAGTFNLVSKWAAMYMAKHMFKPDPKYENIGDYKINVTELANKLQYLAINHKKLQTERCNIPAIFMYWDKEYTDFKYIDRLCELFRKSTAYYVHGIHGRTNESFRNIKYLLENYT